MALSPTPIRLYTISNPSQEPGYTSVSHDLRAWSASFVMAITMPECDLLEYGQS